MFPSILLPYESRYFFTSTYYVRRKKIKEIKMLDYNDPIIDNNTDYYRGV